MATHDRPHPNRLPRFTPLNKNHIEPPPDAHYHFGYVWGAFGGRRGWVEEAVGEVGEGLGVVGSDLGVPAAGGGQV